MRDLLEPEIDKYRIRGGPLVERYGNVGDGTCGGFGIPVHMNASVRRPREILGIIASSGEGWDHVSVSLPLRCPTWTEMEIVKRLFFKVDEAAMQLHVPVTDHISFHPHCLHLWRPHDIEIPRPPAWMVGPQTAAGGSALSPEVRAHLERTVR
jgi:hypothetical protein